MSQNSGVYYLTEMFSVNVQLIHIYALLGLLKIECDFQTTGYMYQNRISDL